MMTRSGQIKRVPVPVNQIPESSVGVAIAAMEELLKLEIRKLHEVQANIHRLQGALQELRR